MSQFYEFLEGLGQINDVIKDATNKLGVLSRLRCLAEFKHFKSVEEDDDGLNSEIVRRTALIQGNIDLDFYTSHLVSITLTEDFFRSSALELSKVCFGVRTGISQN